MAPRRCLAAALLSVLAAQPWLAAAARQRAGVDLSPRRAALAVALATSPSSWAAPDGRPPPLRLLLADPVFAGAGFISGDALPDYAPVVAASSLEGFSRVHLEKERMLREQPWLPKWVWAPELFVRMPGKLSCLSGHYILMGMDVTFAIWARLGHGSNGTVIFSFDEETGDWIYSCATERRPQEVFGPAWPDAVLGVALAAPEWPSEIRMARRRSLLVRLLLGRAPLLRRVQGEYIEGMPVYTSPPPAGEVGRWWVVSVEGRWHFGVTEADLPFTTTLLEDGLFNLQRSMQLRCTSEPHAGRAPDAVLWESRFHGRRVGLDSVAKSAAKGW